MFEYERCRSANLENLLVCQDVGSCECVGVQKHSCWFQCVCQNDSKLITVDYFHPSIYHLSLFSHSCVPREISKLTNFEKWWICSLLNWTFCLLKPIDKNRFCTFMFMPLKKKLYFPVVLYDIFSYVASLPIQEDLQHMKKCRHDAWSSSSSHPFLRRNSRHHATDENNFLSNL